MELEKFFEQNGITKERTWLALSYNNIENILGKDVWICDYRLGQGGATNKPIRSIKPTQVRIFDNEQLPENKQVKYSPIYFKEIKNGKITSKIIAPYDNTGYRWYFSVSVNIFEDEKACLLHYKQQIKRVLSQYDDEINRLSNDRKAISELLIGY